MNVSKLFAVAATAAILAGAGCASSPPPADTRPAPRTQEETKKAAVNRTYVSCDKCHAVVEAAKFCSSCGANVEEAKAPEVASGRLTNTQKSSKGAGQFFIILNKFPGPDAERAIAELKRDQDYSKWLPQTVSPLRVIYEVSYTGENIQPATIAVLERVLGPSYFFFTQHENRVEFTKR